MEHRAPSGRAFQGLSFSSCPTAMLLIFALMSLLQSSQGTPIPNNPCIPANIKNDRLHHPYPYDRTKYIQCNEYGKAYVMSCAPGQQWSAIHETCAGMGAMAVNPVPAAVPPMPAGHNGMKVMMTSGGTSHQNNHQHNGYSYNYQYSNHQQSSSNHVHHSSNNGHHSSNNGHHSGNNGHHSSSMHVPASIDVNENSAYLYVVASMGGLPDQLHCESRHARYMSVPDNGHMYYECVDGKPQQMSCPGDQVWVNPLRQCVDLTEHAPSSNNVQVQAPSHNPCVGSDSRYHPYPNDPHKYMECTNWQRVTVWECGPQQMWSQQTQSCTDLNVMTPVTIIVQSAPQPRPAPRPQPVPQPPPPAARRPSVVVQPQPRRRVVAKHSGYPCLFSKSLYHPVPGNAKRYIQCNAFGQAFLRICGPNKIWDDFYKTCVGRHDASEDSETRTFIDVGEEGDEDMAAMEASGTVIDSSFMAADLLPGQASRMSTDIMNCPPGSVFDRVMSLCIQFSETENDLHDNCQDGLHWDDVALRCVQIGVPVEAPGESMLRTYEERIRRNTGTVFNDFGTSYSSDGNYSPVPSSQDNTVIYSGENPCGTEKNKFYYEFPKDPHFYIQCDEMKNVFIKPCDVSEIWSQDILTCVPDLASNPDMDMPDLPDVDSSNDTTPDSNPCQTSKVTYHKHANKHQFIVCVHNTPYPMPCPYGSYWWQDVETCFWPHDHYKYTQ